VCGIIVLIYIKEYIMEINVRKIAELAALEIDKDNFSDFEAQFKDIINMVSELPEYGKFDVFPEPMKLREDVIENNNISQNDLLSNAHEIVNNYFTAPKTVEYL
jgi:aspartyl-tRNA(Asn)/glutamyl-tRNA(Gln) amidotransferase subunit C